jgi:hypothetical protein
MTTTGRSSSRGRQDPSHAARRQRDAGLERGRSLTKGIAAVSVAAVAATGVYLSQALPGHSASTPTSTGGSGAVGAATPVAPSSGSSAASSSGGSSAGAGISTPAAAPAPAYQQAPVTSGSS